MLSVFAPVIATAATVGDVNLSGHCSVVDAPATLRLDPEISSDPVDIDLAGSVALDDHRAANVGRVDASRSIAFYDERPGHVANVYVARAVVYRHIPADILDPKIAGAIGDVNRSGGAHDGEIARSVAGFEGADVEHFQIAAAVGDIRVHALGHLNDEVERGGGVVIARAPILLRNVRF